jgi:hypothetical protein
MASAASKQVLVGLNAERDRRPVRLAYQPPANSTFLSEQISHQQQPTVIFSQNKSAPTISHQPNQQGARLVDPRPSAEVPNVLRPSGGGFAVVGFLAVVGGGCSLTDDA